MSEVLVERNVDFELEKKEIVEYPGEDAGVGERRELRLELLYGALFELFALSWA